MGVLGLTTYLREHRKIADILSTDSSSPRINVVVDGWSFIYDLHTASGLPWVYGGEYAEFSALVTTTVRAMVQVGLNMHWVFDGPAPAMKFPTLISRIAQNGVANPQIFFRTSRAARANPRFLYESRMLPPFCYSACVDALYALAETTDHVVVYHADEEGDPFAVELAGRLGAFVIGTDSDFVVLNAEGYLGYIPLTEMVWSADEPIQPAPESVEDTDFQQVRNSKSRKRAAAPSSFGRGIIPPENASGLSLKFSVYTPAKLAAHLNVPIPILPLLGALVGNDFTNQSSSPRKNVQMLFFDRQLSLVQRITRVANTIHSILSGTSQKGKQKQVESVMDLIDRAVNALLIRSISSMGSGEVEEIIDRIVEATLQYALPKNEDNVDQLWPTDVCALHQADLCPILPMFSNLVAAEAANDDQEDETELLMRNDIRGQYLSAYRQGRLHAKVLDVLNTQSYWPRLFLEEPNLETVSRSLGRPIREWSYAVLHDGLGLPSPEPPEPEPEDDQEGESVVDVEDVVDQEDAGEEEEEDENALIDVVESDSEDERPPKNVLRALQQLNSADLDQRNPAVPRVALPPTVTEYLRRGTRIADEPVPVPALRDLIASVDFALDLDGQPLVLQPEDTRFTLLLRVLKSDTPGVLSLPREQLAVALCLRWVLQTLHGRAVENGGSKEREKERWTRHEAQCLLSAFAWSPTDTTRDPTLTPFPEDRNVQLTAQVLSTFETIENFAQTLLINTNERLPSPVSRFSGAEFHACLTGAHAPVAAPKGMWDACLGDLDDVFADETRQRKKAKKAAPAPARYVPPHKRGAGLFDLLADAAA
uniref:Asteroid domain-containing protein n=1 Tax=Mycena chlorophos TaxID=658473 RepID=A0ABQ0M351_MYCCL|nr:predicted protein [Mycena chlorophos]